MRIINRLKNLSKREKVLVITLLFLASLLLGVGIAALLVRNNQSITNQEYNNVSYPISFTDIEPGNEDAPLQNNESITEMPNGLNINNFDNYIWEISKDTEGCDLDEGIITFRKKQSSGLSTDVIYEYFLGSIVNRIQVGNNKFEFYKSNLTQADDENYKTYPFAFYPWCGGAAHWKVKSINIELNNLTNVSSTVFLGGLQFVPNKLEHTPATVISFAHDGSNLTQLAFTFNVGRFLNETYKDNCLSDSNSNVSYPKQVQSNSGIDVGCLANKLSTNNVFLNQVKDYIVDQLDEMGLVRDI